MHIFFPVILGLVGSIIGFNVYSNANEQGKYGFDDKALTVFGLKIVFGLALAGIVLGVILNCIFL